MKSSLTGGSCAGMLQSTRPLNLTASVRRESGEIFYSWLDSKDRPVTCYGILLFLEWERPLFYYLYFVMCFVFIVQANMCWLGNIIQRKDLSWIINQELLNVLFTWQVTDTDMMHSNSWNHCRPTWTECWFRLICNQSVICIWLWKPSVFPVEFLIRTKLETKLQQALNVPSAGGKLSRRTSDELHLLQPAEIRQHLTPCKLWVDEWMQHDRRHGRTECRTCHWEYVQILNSNGVRENNTKQKTVNYPLTDLSDSNV